MTHIIAGMGAAFSFISAASANLRQKEDPYNHFMGGFAAGMIRGLTSEIDPITRTIKD